MSFELTPNPELEAAVLAQSLAVDAVAVATQFDQQILAQYRSMFENYWKIGRSDFTRDQLQSRSDRMGPTELAILLKAGVFVQAMVSIGAPLESKYHSPPYGYTIVDVSFQDGHVEASIATFNDLYALMQIHGNFTAGKLVLGELVGDWAPVEEPQPEEGLEEQNA